MLNITKKTFTTWLESYENDHTVQVLDVANKRIGDVFAKFSSAPDDEPFAKHEALASFAGSAFFMAFKFNDAGARKFIVAHNPFRLSHSGFPVADTDKFFALAGFPQEPHETPDFIKLPDHVFKPVTNGPDGPTTFWTPPYEDILKCLTPDELDELKETFMKSLPNVGDPAETLPSEPHEVMEELAAVFVPPFLVFSLESSMQDAAKHVKETDIHPNKVFSSIAYSCLLHCNNLLNTHASEPENSAIINDIAAASKDLILSLWNSWFSDDDASLPMLNGQDLATSYLQEGEEDADKIKAKIKIAATVLNVSITPTMATGTTAAPQTIEVRHPDLNLLANSLKDGFNSRLNTSEEGSNKSVFMTETEQSLVRLFHSFEDGAPIAKHLNASARQFMMAGKKVGIHTLAKKLRGHPYHSSVAVSNKLVLILQHGHFILTDQCRKPDFPSFFYMGHISIQTASLEDDQHQLFELRRQNNTLTNKDIEESLYIQVHHPKTVEEIKYFLNNLIAVYSFIGNSTSVPAPGRSGSRRWTSATV